MATATGKYNGTQSNGGKDKIKASLAKPTGMKSGTAQYAKSGNKTPLKLK